MKKGLIKSQEDIELIAHSGAILGEVLANTAALVRPGITTWELNEFAEAEIKRLGGEPSFKGYGPKNNPFPAGLCTSINHVIVHGIPSRHDMLREGDIVGLDLGVRYKGFYSDGAVTVGVGRIGKDAERLLRVTKEAMELAILEAKPGNRIGHISNAMQKVVEAAGFNVVRDLIGHGVGYAVHEDPQVPCYGKPSEGIEIREGMVLAIEPMVTLGDWRTIGEPEDWPVRTKDGRLAAHFEHTVAVTPSGPRILTLPGVK